MRKKLVALAMATVMCFSLSACSSKDKGTTPTEAPSGDATEAPADATDAPSDDATTDDANTPSGDTELVYWSMWNNTEPQAKVIQEAIDAYTADTGIKVKVEWKGRDISKIIESALDAGEKIDMFDEDIIRIGEQYASKCMDLEDMAKAADYESYALPALPSTIRRLAGSLKAIGYQPFTSGVFYNKQMFKDAGIEKEPQTWAEFLEVCEKLKASGVAPLALDDAYVRYNFGFHLARYIGQDAVKDVVNEGNWAENEAVLKAAQDMVELKEKGYLSEFAPGAYPDNENTIGYLETAMIVNASWVPAEIKNNTQCDIEWGMFNYPSVDGGKDANTVTNVGGQAFAIPAASPNGQAAFDLIMKITSGEIDQKMALEAEGIPSDTRNTEWPAIIAGCKEAFEAVTDSYDWNMGLNANQNMGEVIQENVLKLFEGKLDAQGFVDAMEAASK